MQTGPDIKLTCHLSGNGPGTEWVKVVNNGGANSSKVFKFLDKNRQHFNRVCFGTGYAELALREDRVERFIAYAAKNGLAARF